MKINFKILLIFLAAVLMVICTYGCKKEECSNIRLITKVQETDSVMMVQEIGVFCDKERDSYLNYMESHYDSANSRTVIKYGEAY